VRWWFWERNEVSRDVKAKFSPFPHPPGILNFTRIKKLSLILLRPETEATWAFANRRPRRLTHSNENTSACYVTPF